MHYISFFFLVLCKFLAKLFYRFDQHWYSSHQDDDWKQVKVIIILNHTSLFEPIFLRSIPISLLWQLSKHLTLPAAQETLKRPIVGRILKALVPKCIPISRKYDQSWDDFLDQITNDSILAIMPEGRMKRINGLDKHGKAMDIKRGVVDILSKVEQGNVLFVYSGGLHHVQAPGNRLPRLFKKIKVNFEIIDLEVYKQSFYHLDNSVYQQSIISDLEHRLTFKAP
ncbi:1-acyl-sn-glycerol-3-phosphate acyltransferase [Thalassomonas sp. M1454]|uniref:1-acyl-sn-glycerol-3-phosphate acyltransferase n=1 Tax=Thalassomonas sp. M1454 TaxID=2594477 RepID=UPI001180CA46|nr:1-acyl-sn-glycerol-3-phosphate acyltransferase [Thalassomonas sp. M1454]TRX56988.1 1-acyl-sn-glycerol-3-phosphate acyltransferase [Thalassomonas sp. M1454]